MRESDEGVHLAALRARGQGLPYATWTGALGTSVATDHPLVEQARDADGSAYLKVRPQPVDVALLWAEAADPDGNVLLWEPSDFGDEALRAAADHRVVQVERIVTTAVLGRHHERVAPWAADAVVRAPLSTHPFGGAGLRTDRDWLRAYAAAFGAARSGGPGVGDFLEHWVLGVPDEAAYLDRVGLRRLLELMP